MYWQTVCLIRAIAVAIVFFSRLATSAYFTQPPSFETADEAGNIKQTNNLGTVYTMGQKVQLTWYIPDSISPIGLKLVEWDTRKSVASFISKCQRSLSRWSPRNSRALSQLLVDVTLRG